MLCAWASLHVARGDLLHSWLSPLADKRNDEWGGVFGLDYIDVSSGVMSAKIRTPTSPGYSAPIAERLGRETGIVVRTVGMITTAKQAEAIVAEGTADMVALARAFLDNPHWGWHAAQALSAEVARPVQYLRSAPKLWPGAALRG